jgi:hypothetical protein
VRADRHLQLACRGQEAAIVALDISVCYLSNLDNPTVAGDGSPARVRLRR